jgi:hypothetical protein
MQQLLNDRGIKARSAATEKPLEEQIPQRYHEFLPLFHEPVLGDLPPERPHFDLKVELIKGTPLSIIAHLYPLTHAEKEYQSEYIKENLA